MQRRAIAVSTAALLALFLAAAPAAADTEYAVTATTMDWRLVVIFTVLGLFAFYIALERVNRGR